LKAGFVNARFDPRFGYALAVSDPPAGASHAGLVVTVHNSVRWYDRNLEAFRDFGKRHGLVVLAPLFPPGLFGDDNPDGYKVLAEHGLRYDEVLHEMVREVCASTGCEADRFFLHGYSGGGQFVHRYLLLHPGRVRAASIGAPGAVTLLDDEQPWWAGVADVPGRFGLSLDLDTLRQVPVQLVVGSDDTDPAGLREQPPSRWWASDAERRRAHRIARLQALQRSLLAVGARPTFELMPGVGHGEGDGPSIALAQGLFAEVLSRAR
jgi:pimeloyl-ACP methyl ester carboxylesterase